MKNLLTVALLFAVHHSFAQSVFKTSLQADSSDAITAVVATADGFVFTGYTSSYGAGSADALVMKMDASGNVAWSKVYGDAQEQTGLSIAEAGDGGYIVLGETQSLDTTGRDIFLFKTDANGNLQWSKVYRGSAGEYAAKLLAADDGFYVAGYTWSFGTANDCLLLKVDAAGNTLWAKHYDGSNFESCFGATLTNDNAVILVGSRSVITTDEAFVVKTDTAGNLIWGKEYGGTGVDQANAVVNTDDDGYVFVGSSELSGPLDYYVVKIADNGAHLWTRIPGTSSWDGAYDIVNDGNGFIITGEGYAGDYYVLHFDNAGMLDWEQIYDNGGWERSSCIAPSASGNSFIAAGFSETAGARDIHVVQFSDNGQICNGQQTQVTSISTQASTVSDVVVTTGTANLSVASIAFAEANAPFSKNEICQGTAPTGTIEHLVAPSSIHVFPNPTEDWVEVQITSREKNLHLNIYNSIGALVYAERLESSQENFAKRISLEDFPKGMYHIKVSGDQSSLSKSLILQ